MTWQAIVGFLVVLWGIGAVHQSVRVVENDVDELRRSLREHSADSDATLASIEAAVDRIGHRLDAVHEATVWRENPFR